jgi:hypothetical protein
MKLRKGKAAPTAGVMFKVQQFIQQATEEAGMQVYSDRISGK